MKNDLTYYMNLNYPTTIETYIEDEQVYYSLEIPDLQGCGAEAQTLDKALEKLQDAKELWISASLKRNLTIPEPVAEDDFSGKFLLRIPTRLHMALVKQAKKEEISLNQYVKSILETHTVLAYEKQKIEGQYENLLQEIKLLRGKSIITPKPILVYASTSSDDESKPIEKEDVDTIRNIMFRKRSLSAI